MKDTPYTISFRLPPFVGGLCMFIVLLLGGITVKSKGLRWGTTSCQAITVHNNVPAKDKAARKQSRYYSRILKWRKPDTPLSGLVKMVVILLVILVVATLGFGIWSVSLFMAAKYVAGTIVGILSLASLFGIIKFLLSQ